MLWDCWLGDRKSIWPASSSALTIPQKFTFVDPT